KIVISCRGASRSACPRGKFDDEKSLFPVGAQALRPYKSIHLDRARVKTPVGCCHEETQGMMKPEKSRIPNNSGKPEKKLYEKYPALFHPVGIIHPVPRP
ncbi:hypothetical protein, partial [Oscillatoria sp. HE19RPO]|uniref:hypothetical protein n=1 Tax=Oscillatoria sp. HE19RPO TaxID=2954806 RepID=UPI0020C415F3